MGKCPCFYTRGNQAGEIRAKLPCLYAHPLVRKSGTIYSPQYQAYITQTKHISVDRYK